MFPTAPSEFTPGQIAYLQIPTQVLYVEIIEYLTAQERCWARPIVLAITGQATQPVAPSQITDTELQVLDLPDSPDIILPANLFTAALDTDYLAVLSGLQAKSGHNSLLPSERSALYVQRFVTTLLAQA